jgi:hypothetical protein
MAARRRTLRLMRILLAAAIYFALVLAAGTALGAIRVPLLVPSLGERTAELLELPLMLVIVAFASHWLQRRTPDLSPRQQLAVGALALLLLLLAECAMGAMLMHKSPLEVLFDKDPVSGSLYYFSVLVFALLPWLWTLRTSRRSRDQSHGADVPSKL